MELSELGFDPWFEEYVGDLLQPEHRLARVTAVDRGSFLVRNQREETSAELAGRLRFNVKSSLDLPSVGDWVSVEYHTGDSPAIIHGVLPRKTFLRRKSPGKVVDFQMIAANIDVAFIVQSCHYDFNVPRLDRYLVMINEGRIEPIIVLSKTDLVSPDELEQRIAQIRHAGISTEMLTLSNTTGQGVTEFRRRLDPGQTYCLVGSSGVGKTTLINHLIGQDKFDTQAVSDSGEGVHTTARRHLLVLERGAMLIDTPGMRELGLVGASNGMDESFAGIHDLSLSCRFSNCTHIQEPGCALLKALESGELSEDRYRSYLKLDKESEYHELSYVEKRKKDKDFGRFVKSVMKHKKRRAKDT